MIIFENENVKLEYDDSIPCVIWTPVGNIFGDEFREPFLMGIDFVLKKIKTVPNLSWLNNVKKLKTTNKADVEWLDKTANDLAYKSGLQKAAFVLPEDVFGKLGIRLYIHFTTGRTDNKLEIKAFNTIEEAKSWLKGIQGIEKNEVRISINQKQ